MTINNYSIRKAAATMLLLFPILMLLAFAMHFHSINSFFNFRLSYGTYDAGKLFDALVSGNGHSFMMAHSVAFLTVPLFFIAVCTLAWLLYSKMPRLTIAALITGIIGCTALAAVFGAWLSFTGIATLNNNYYDGGRAAFIELVKMKGMLKLITLISYLSFFSIIMLAAGLIKTKMFKLWSMLCIVAGAALFIVFMDLDNWMFIGALLLLIGFIPMSKKLKSA